MSISAPRTRPPIAWFSRTVADEAPDAVVMTGDLTMRATTREFEAGGAWLKSLGVPVTLEVGNHDIPLLLGPRCAGCSRRICAMPRSST